MDDSELEGTLVLEQMAEVGKVDAFYEAIDADDFKAAASLLRLAQVDDQTIALVIEKMRLAGE